MFANATLKVGISQRVVATLVACAVVLSSIGFYTTVQAASLADISDTLSTSEPSTTSAHTIEFTLATSSTGLTGSDTTTITFESFSGVATVGSGDVVVTVDGTPDAVGTFNASGQTISFDGIDAAAGDVIVVAIADGKITNPAGISSYDISINTGTAGDSGKTMVAIVNVVLVEAIVDTTFTFTIDGMATSTAINSDSTTGSTSATSINFGELIADTPEVLAQELRVQTNSRNGYTVTVESDGDLESANGAIIDSFTDGTNIALAGTAWTVPGDDVLDPLTWGHWGMTSNDTNLANNLNAANSYIAVDTAPREIMSHDGPADGTTQDVGLATIGYKIEITPLQEAADDYNTTLTYIATPTF